MELHERFMKIAEAECSIFKIIENSQEPIDTVIGKYLDNAFVRLKDSTVCKQDLVLLRLLLCQIYKFNYVSVKNDKITLQNIEFHQLVEFLKNSNLCKDKGNQSILYDVMVLHLVLLIDKKKFVIIFQEFQSNHIKTQFEDGNKLSTNTYLKVLVCFLSAWEILKFLHEKKKSGALNEILLESCKKVLQPSVLGDVKTLVNYDKNTDWHALQSVLSKIVSMSQSTKILSKYMDQLLVKGVDLTTVCALSDFIFPMNSMSRDCDYCLIHNLNLLNSIQNNLHSETPQKRKEALYLLKKLVDFLETNEETLKSLKLEVCLQLIKDSINPFICNNSNESSVIPIKKVKIDFILVLEALEEKQKHLVVPSLSLIDNLIQATLQHRTCGNCFDSSWLYCVFARLLKHHNNSIVKWGLLKIFKLPIIYKSEEYLMLIVNTLNNTFLYENTCVSSETNFSDALTKWFEFLQNSSSSQLIELFLYCCGQIKWGSVPIFQVLQSMLFASLLFDNILQWEEEPLHTMKLLVSQNISLHPPMIRMMSHSQLIQLMCHTSRIGNLKSLINFLTVFSDEDLKEPMSLPSLKLCLAKIENSKVVRFVISICDKLRHDDEQVTISIPVFSLVIQLLYDGEMICQTERCSIAQELKAVFLCLDRIDVRPYISLPMITQIINFANGFFGWDCEPPDCIKVIFMSYKDTVYKFILKLFNNEAFKYEHIDIYDRCLRDVFGIHDVEVNSNELEARCIKVIDNASEHSTAQVLFALNCWSNISHKYRYEDEIFFQRITNILTISRSERHWNDMKGQTGTDFYDSMSKLIKNHVSTLNLNDLEAKHWLDISSFILDAAGNHVLVHLSDIAKVFSTVVANDTKSLNDFKILITSFWKCNFGNKRDKEFWLVAQKLTESINSSKFLQNPALREVSEDFTNRMLKEGRSLPGLMYILVTCSDIDKNFNHFVDALFEGLIHGQVLRRDQRIYTQTCLTGVDILNKYSLKDNLLENFNAHDFLNRQGNVDAAVRSAAVVQLCKALDDKKENADVLLPLVLQKWSSIQKKRYYADSQLHRLKHRIMQTLLLLQPYLNKESTEILYHTLRDSILEDTDQHSIRLMKEWLLIRIYWSHVDFLPDLWLFFDEMCDQRPNCANSLIGIVWHIAETLNGQYLEDFISEALKKLIICCMGHQFGMRLYGQIFFVKMYDLLGNDSKLREEYVNMYNATLASLSCSKAKENPPKIDEDFFFVDFDPLLHYSLETIYYQLPRLCNISFDEFITKEEFGEQINVRLSSISMAIRNSDKVLDGAVIPYYILKSNDNSKPEEIESSDIPNDMQKKITPWRSMLPNEEELEQMTSSSSLQIKQKHKKDFIVIASLVEKAQNLGGIARTCEIFGVQELVISNLKQIQQREFQALSVSADKWIKMTEAEALSLPKYFMGLKDEGWTLVGAEQTANSKDLLEFKFPKKTVLVLGNEKNGIPANIIPLLDVCVEIPQYGIIRSLNVHVTSAICIWEYNKQHQIVS